MSSNSTLHVCFICPYIEGYLDPGSRTHVGGAQRQQYLLGSRLRDSGHTVSFIAFETDGPTHELINGFHLWRTLPPTNAPVRVLESFFKLMQSIRRVDADVYYVRGNPPLTILASYSSLLLGKRLVYVVANDSNIELARLPSHHGLFRYTLPKLTYLDAIRRSDRVVSQTPYQHDILRDVFGIPSMVIPNGYSVPPAESVLPAVEREHVIWVGSLNPDQKRPERFLRLAERLPDVPFRMVGTTDDAEYRRRIEGMAAGLPNLTYEGFVPPDEILDEYRDAVALVNTSDYEGFPNTFLEAWRVGVPVVSLHHTLDGVLTSEEVGYHANTMDEMVNIVERLWESPQTVDRVGRNGRQYLADNFSLDSIYEEYACVFDGTDS